MADEVKNAYSRHIGLYTYNTLRFTVDMRELKTRVSDSWSIYQRGDLLRIRSS